MRARAGGFSVAFVGFLLALAAPAAPAAHAASLGPPIELSDHGASPSVAAMPDGFVAVWHEGPTSIEGRVVTRLLGPDGEPLGAAVPVDPLPRGQQTTPVVATDRAGRFVVAWTGDHRSPGATSDVFFRRFGPGATPEGPTARANAGHHGGDFTPALAMEPGGGFAIAWNGGGALWSRRFVRGGAPTRPEALLSRWDDETFAHSIAFAGDEHPGGFVAAWSFCLPPACTRDLGVLRPLRPGGKPAGPPEFLRQGVMELPRVLTGARGEVLLVGAPGQAGAVTVQRRAVDGQPLERIRTLSSAPCDPARKVEHVVAAAFLPPRRLAVLRLGTVENDSGQADGSLLWLEVLDAVRGGSIEGCRLVAGGHGVGIFGGGDDSLVFGRDGQILVAWAEYHGGAGAFPDEDPAVRARVLASP